MGLPIAHAEPIKPPFPAQNAPDELRLLGAVKSVHAAIATFSPINISIEFCAYVYGARNLVMYATGFASRCANMKGYR